MFKKHTHCRVCNNDKLTPYLDLGMMPLSNNLLSSADEIAPRYPLEVLLCERCGLSQLSVVIDPVELFGHYVYRSSISQGYKDHCRQMAFVLKEQYNLTDESFHIDIAGNDGALLKEFKNVLGHKVLNVDPAKNLIQICEDKGVRYYNTFWNKEAAQHIKANWPSPKLITATNVFAHVDDVKEFLEAIKLVLRDDGVAVIEFPYLIDFIEKNEFDTIYFEHLSYFSITPLAYLCHLVGLVLTDVTHHDIHGGSVRCFIQHTGEQSPSVSKYINMEISQGYSRSIYLYRDWASKIANVLMKFRNLMNSIEGKKVYGFAASAKGNTLLNCAGITSKQMPYIIDQTPEKIGKYSPGTGIAIEGFGRLINDQPDYLVVLSWNFGFEIMQKCRNFGYKGKFIYPLTCSIID